MNHQLRLQLGGVDQSGDNSCGAETGTGTGFGRTKKREEEMQTGKKERDDQIRTE